jgi:AraC-like DNA-binding protein/mannose-6-phosphate isomerase-like protein (cupin superfamily)
MSQKRRSGEFEQVGSARSDINLFARDYAPGHRVRLHFHDRDQLLYASRGVMTVQTGADTWVVPTQRAVWIPAGTSHAIVMSGAVSMRALYLRARLAQLPRSCCVVNVTPLLRELIAHACAFAALSRRIPWQRHLIDVILDQLALIQTVPLQLPNASDARARRITGLLIANPGDRRPLGELCHSAGATKRTVERLFQAEMGMTPGKWRQQLRLMQALRLLAGGAKVTQAALDAGYSTPSAFIAMFRKALGTTPRSYFSATTQR